MKKFEFTLGRILDYRQSLLEREKNTLMQLVSAQMKLEDRRDAAISSYRSCARELQETAEKGTTVIQLQQIDLRLQAGARKVESLEQELTQLLESIERQRETVKEASQQVTVLEKLRDKQREDYNYAERKEENERISEIISTGIVRQSDQDD